MELQREEQKQEFELDDFCGADEDPFGDSQDGLITEDEFISNRVYVKKSFVQKSNLLAMDAKFDFSALEQDAANYITTLIEQPVEDYDTKQVQYKVRYEFNLSDLCKATGTAKSGRAYSRFREAIRNLKKKDVLVPSPKGTFVSVSWLSYFEFDPHSGRIVISIDDKMIPYVCDLHNKFLSYQPEYTLLMNGKYSKRLYEKLKAYLNMISAKSNPEHDASIITTYEIALDKLKSEFSLDGIDSYNHFGVFRTKILNVALKEINEMTDINIDYTAVKSSGKAVDSIIFSLSYKDEVSKMEVDKRNILKVC